MPDDHKHRTPQLNDDVTLKLTLPASTEEWADELLEEWDCGDVERTDEGLVVTFTVGGNANAISNARSFLDDIELALTQGEIDPMRFTLTAEPSPRHLRVVNAVETES